MQFDNFLEHNDVYLPNSKKVTKAKLPAGIYKISQLQTGEIIFQKMKSTYDQLVDLPSDEYQQVVGEINQFLSPGTREKFDHYGFLYKRSALLFGRPGTGKTCIVNKICEKVISDGGVILFNPRPDLLESAYEALDSIQPETLTMVIFEELDEHLKRYEKELLHVLDGEVQKQNVIYLATTNFIDQIPARICRPGRFSSLVEVKYPGEEARRAYLSSKNITGEAAEELIQLTVGFSIDEVKETILAIKCLAQTPDNIINRIRKSKGLKNFDVEQEGITKKKPLDINKYSRELQQRQEDEQAGEPFEGVSEMAYERSDDDVDDEF